MEPEIHQEDIIIVKKVDPAKVNKGDIVSYYLKEDDVIQGLKAGSIVTHEVIEEPYEEGGVYHFQTQGTAVGAVKDPPITGDQIVGRYVVTIPILKYVYNFFVQPYGLIVFLLVLLLLFGREALNLRRIIKTKPEDYIDEEGNAINFEDIPPEELEKILKAQGFVKEDNAEKKAIKFEDIPKDELDKILKAQGLAADDNSGEPENEE